MRPGSPLNPNRIYGALLFARTKRRLLNGWLLPHNAIVPLLARFYNRRSIIPILRWRDS
jgi:hypothetical protein